MYTVFWKWKFFHEECERLQKIFSRLRYPDDLVQSTIRRFIESKVSEDSHTRVAGKREAPVRIVLPYKGQKSANVVRKQLADLSRKINADINISGAPAARRAAKRSPILIWKRKGNPWMDFLLSWFSWLAVLLVGAYARRRRRRSYPTWRPYSS